REQVGLVAEAGQLPGVQLGAACYGDHLRQATGRSDIEDVAGAGWRQRDRLTGRDSVLRVEPVGEDLCHLTARLDIEHVNVACFRRSYRDPDLLADVVDRRSVAGGIPVKPDLNIEAGTRVDDDGLRADHDPLGGCQ